MKRERIALIGLGAIGARVFELLRASTEPTVDVVAVLLPADSETRRSPLLSEWRGPVCADAAELLAHRPSLVVECAGHAAIDRHAPALLAAGCDLVVSSIGALALAERFERLKQAADQGASQIMLPAGSIAAIDWLAAARMSGLQRVLYRSRKPPVAWLGTPAEKAVGLSRLEAASVFFRGTAREAALAYPKNANVAATVALAGLGLDQTLVELIADPAASGNIHEIESQSTIGELTMRVLGLPDPKNPKTSMTTAFSMARAALNRSARIAV